MGRHSHDYYEGSATIRRHQPTTCLPSNREGGDRPLSTFTTSSIDQVGAQLYPGDIATPTP